MASTSPSRSDEELVLAAVRNALGLVNIHDDGMVSEPYRQGFSVQIAPAGEGKYRALVWDAEPWKSGRPKTSEARMYDVAVAVTPLQSGHYE